MAQEAGERGGYFGHPISSKSPSEGPRPKKGVAGVARGKKEQGRHIKDFSLRANREKLRLLPDLGGIHVSHNFMP